MKVGERVPRAERIHQLECAPTAFAARDPNRLLEPTKASAGHKMTDMDLDEAVRRRVTGSAHSQKIAMSGRDLAFAGRARPAWAKAMM